MSEVACCLFVDDIFFFGCSFILFCHYQTMLLYTRVELLLPAALLKLCSTPIASLFAEYVFTIRLQCKAFLSFKTSSRHFQDVLERVFKSFLKTRNCYAADVFIRLSRHVLKTFSRHVFKMSLSQVLKTPSRRFGSQQNVLVERNLSVSS